VKDLPALAYFHTVPRCKMSSNSVLVRCIKSHILTLSSIRHMVTDVGHMRQRHPPGSLI
jgi:hypothetical protein